MIVNVIFSYVDFSRRHKLNLRVVQMFHTSLTFFTRAKTFCLTYEAQLSEISLNKFGVCVSENNKKFG